ncbi:MAG: response regulator [Candidatus Omnitrophica bacterium]|nr:response regulator [Candidatus Omnitrophota bacterium]
MDKAKILIVEDEQEVLAYFKGSLERKFFADIETAQDGRQAIDAIRNNDFDLVIMDLKMPQCNGLDVMRRVKKTKELPDTIIVTAYDSGFVSKEAKEVGAVDYIPKPLNMEVFLSKAKAILTAKGLFVEK